jgi:hypothetical protein
MSHALNIRMQDKTLKEADRLMNLFNAPSRSDVIRRAIELSDILSKAISRGEKIMIVGKGGRREIFLPGLMNG